jgi:hypothetical protein
MAPASGPVHDPKMFPAATMDDQEKIMEGEQTVSIVTTPPFSSPDPNTDALKMEIVDSNVSAYDARENAAAAKLGESSEDYDSMKVADLKALAEERGLDTEGAKKADLVSALQADDASEFKAADFKDRVNAATTQEELDAAAEFYANSGKSYSSVEAAVEAKQSEIDES